ncbi:hypothetical protein B0H11DRAFT_2353621 [Mycena galericulata]|nr:hypothetical protein B0H11DRAFT_2353621 [Mycena galericulata]
MSDYLTLLDAFRAHINNPHTKNRPAVECGDERWTYDDLDAISTGLALEIEALHGRQPTVAIIAENLPYTFALHLAIWKLGGIPAPIDYHTPKALLQPMLQKIAPTFVVIPSTETATQKIISDLGLFVVKLTPKDTTMTALCQRFMEVSDLPLDQYPPPEPTSISVYLFTSSASDVTNIKCVPLTHQTVVAQAGSMLAWNRRTFPDALFEHVRILGWGPFSHMITFVDIANNFYLTGGCYIFGLIPSGYFIPGVKHADETRDVPALLLESMEIHRPDTFMAVPLIFEGMMRTVTSEHHSLGL